MTRRKRRKKKRYSMRLICCLVIMVAGMVFIPWIMNPENFREEKNKINSFLYRTFEKDSYNAKSLIMVDCSNDSVFISKRENEQQLPANNAEAEAGIWVIEMILKGAMKRIVVPNASISELGDIAYKDNEAIGYEITLAAVPDESGQTHYEYIKKEGQQL